MFPPTLILIMTGTQQKYHGGGDGGLNSKLLGKLSPTWIPFTQASYKNLNDNP